MQIALMDHESIPVLSGLQKISRGLYNQERCDCWPIKDEEPRESVDMYLNQVDKLIMRNIRLHINTLETLLKGKIEMNQVEQYSAVYKVASTRIIFIRIREDCYAKGILNSDAETVNLECFTKKLN